MATEEPNRHELDAMLARRLDRIELLYGQILNRLWLAHGAASGIIISILSSHGDRKYNQLLWPLLIFVAGMALLAISDLALMIKDAKSVKHYRSAFSILDVLVADIEAPLERLGMKGLRLKAQVASAALLTTGLIVSLIMFFNLR